MCPAVADCEHWTKALCPASTPSKKHDWINQGYSDPTFSLPALILIPQLRFSVDAVLFELMPLPPFPQLQICTLLFSCQQPTVTEHNCDNSVQFNSIQLHSYACVAVVLLFYVVYEMCCKKSNLTGLKVVV